MSILNKIFGDANEKIIKSLQPTINEINRLEEKIKNLSDDELRKYTSDLKAKVNIDPASAIDKEKEQARLDGVLPEAFALVREASWRVLRQRHFDVQLIGGIILHRGMIAEMKTGEGKTLVATLPLFLNSLAGRGVQLITVNDYLSRLGAGWMAPVFYLLGASTGVIVHDAAYKYDPDFIDETQYDDRLKHFRPIERREAYRCDILYGTNNEFGFDYLRDNMVPDLERMVQRELYYAIVDEIDSILIDEARTPLIISAPAEESNDRYYKFAQYVRRLTENEDYNIDEKMRAVTLTEAGITKMEKMLGVENIYTAGGVGEVHHIEQALKAHALFKLDRDYVVKDNEVIIVDEFTGRLMHGRRYSEGLHQAIEAKENVEIKRESQTLATITFQNYFRMYSKLSGMTGTAATEAEEFSKIYKLDTIVIPTNRPNVRQDLNDLIYRTEAGKYQAVIEEIKRRNKLGQPILVGTISIEKNEELAGMLAQYGIEAQILNAKNHEKEAKIIADAGKVGAVTIATNMAGRGVDIMLGGKPPLNNNGIETEEYIKWKDGNMKVLELGGLHVIGTERHESRRIDNQLRGRAGRQGDPGSSQFFVSMDDDLMRIFGGDRMKSIMTTLRVPEDMPIENKLISKSLESAQQKVEGHNFDIRKHLVEYDDVINKHREAIYRKRREILFSSERSGSQAEESGENLNLLSDIILGMVENEVEQVVAFHTAAEQPGEWNVDEVYQVATTIWPADKNLKADLDGLAKSDHKLDKARIRTKIIEHLMGLAREYYSKMSERAIEAGVNWPEVEKAVLIRSIDTLWIEHLEAMSSVRQGIGLRGYGQRDPLVEYKKEAFHLFNELNSYIQKEVVYSIFKVGAMYDSLKQGFNEPSLADRAKQFVAPSKEMAKGAGGFSEFRQNSNSTAPGGQSVDTVKPKVKDEEGNKIGRNDPCPCGSGKKFKKCCGK